MFEFHISRQVRSQCSFDQSVFEYNGNVILADFGAAQNLSTELNQRKILPQSASAAQLFALGLIDEILHHLISAYRREVNPDVMTRALVHLESTLGSAALDQALIQFIQEFPPLALYRQETTLEYYLSGSTAGLSHRAVALEEMMLLWVTNQNPAAGTYNPLFTDSSLIAQTKYPELIQQLSTFFGTQPCLGGDNQNLMDMLLAPARAAPDSLAAQLEFIQNRWGRLLGQYLIRLLRSLDFTREEQKMHFMGPGPSLIPTFDLADFEREPERFSPDQDWMPRLVLMAKSTYVWLDQLSKKYKRPITRLDQIPDEELDALSAWGITGLWLIGVWERSSASARIKQMCGNPEAISSAYSLSGYWIASDLGGEAAFDNLRQRAWDRGIRLASDMVPNHMGIDSPWVIEHPDWFVSLDHSPFPAYTFNGPDLSSNPHVGIFLEDHYYNRTDAAVVFKRIDYSTGEARYIYHGNDGTNMPWNDTAQLNYLKPEVREAVIQTILHVARRFPIIRFDAAMTLARRHYQRLWYPEPGSGGDIPSRSECGLTKQQMEEAMPVEFWREVVDRSARETSDTLLLAEAFWLMEGYFVRTLGMHRVYNSAFMNMLRDEDNAKYRSAIKNTLEFDPEVLKRYVNFMNNPDEKTAVEQFGKGDKYIGVCTLMSTLPGLPMFGHGQIEGYTEKYGMEYRRAYWDEQPDQDLVERHRREIFPILHRRATFAGYDNFLLYDFYNEDGGVNEDVFAYSNSKGDDTGLVLYLNRFTSTSGWINTSAGYSVKTGPDQKQIIRRQLWQGLHLSPAPDRFVIFRDIRCGLEYIRSSQQIAENGLHFQLNAYQCLVLLDFREVQDDAGGTYRRLNEYLNGGGVDSISESRRELILQPVLQPFKEIANRDYFEYLLANRCKTPEETLPTSLLDEARRKFEALLDGAARLESRTFERQSILLQLDQALSLVLTLPQAAVPIPLTFGTRYQSFIDKIVSGLDKQPDRWPLLLAWAFITPLRSLADGNPERHIALMNEWMLDKVLQAAFQYMGLDWAQSKHLLETLQLLIQNDGWIQRQPRANPQQVVSAWFDRPLFQKYLKVNTYQGVQYFKHESFQEFLWWMAALAVLNCWAAPSVTLTETIETLIWVADFYQSVLTAEAKSGFEAVKFLTSL